MLRNKWKRMQCKMDGCKNYEPLYFFAFNTFPFVAST